MVHNLGLWYYCANGVPQSQPLSGRLNSTLMRPRRAAPIFNKPGFMVICHAYLQPMFICSSPDETVDLLSFHGCPLTSACQDRFFIRSKSALITTRNGYSEGTPTLTFVCCSYSYYLIKYLIKCSLIIFWST